MIGTYDVIVETLSIVLGLGTVGVCLYRRSFLRYLSLNVYLLTAVAITFGRIYVRTIYGYTSPEYFYFYYTSDALGNIVAYLLIGSLFDRLLRESIFRRYVRPTLLIFFLLIVGISFRFLGDSAGRFYSRFMAEFQQNMYFVGVLFTFLLWISMSYLQAESRRFVMLVSGLGIYFSSHAANYALQFLVPSLRPVLTAVPPLAYNLMVFLWLYTFWRIPEEAPAAEQPERAGPREVPAEVHLEFMHR